MSVIVLSGPTCTSDSSAWASDSSLMQLCFTSSVNVGKTVSVLL